MYRFHTYKKYLFILLTGLLLFTVSIPGLVAASRVDTQSGGESPENAIEITPGQSIKGTIRDADTSVWYKLSPTSVEISSQTHLTFETTGELDTELRFYKNLDYARENEATYSDDDSGEGYNAAVMVPIAWEGPYYLEISANRAGEFGLGNTPSNNPPEDHPNGGACALEYSIDRKPSGVEILSDLRNIRDNLLSRSKKGKEITSLYYKVSPVLIATAITQPEFRSDLYKQVVKLQRVIDEVELISSGEKSTHVLSEKEYAALKELKELILAQLSEELKADVEKVWEQTLPEKAVGEKLDEILEDGNLLKEQDTGKDVPARILIKLKEDQDGQQNKNVNSWNALQKDIRNILKENRSREMKLAPLEGNNGKVAISHTYVLHLSDQKSLVRTVKELEYLPEVEYATIDRIYQAASQDVNYSSQWALENTGQFDGTAESDIQYKKLQQELKKGNLRETLIAVVDTGVDYTLADLAGKVRTDIGLDLVNEDKDPIDDNDHGTHVAGVIAAKSNNGYSMAGIHPYSRILPIKVLDEDGSGYGSDIALGIKYAVDNGAKVINLSLGTDSMDPVIEDVLKYAAKKQVTVVAASGNDGENRLSYPASSKYVIAVGATNSQDQPTSFSNFGEGLDVVAPGEKIASLVINGNVQYADGTSMATPHAAAVVGLLYSKKPSITLAEVMKVLQESSKDLGDKGYDEEFGWGRLDAYKAITRVSGSNSNLKVKKLQVNKAKLSLLSGDTEQLVLTATFSDGTKGEVTTEAEWASKNAKAASVEAGLVRALNKGKTTVTAAYRGKKASVSLTIGERNPVILIPGIGGSQLYTEDDDLSWIGLWETTANLPIIHDLELEPEKPGSTKVVSKNNVEIFTSTANHGLYGISRLTDTDAIEGAKQYEYMIADLEQAGYVPGKTLFGMPYDWRFDIRDQQSLLRNTIEKALDESGSDKVDIVAHSMGGLLVKEYLLSDKDAKKTINSVITMGTPYLGAAKASKALIFGDNFGHPFLFPSTGQTIAKHAPSVYQLAPSDEYNKLMEQKYKRPVYLYIDQTGGLHPQKLSELTDLYPYQPLVKLAADTHKSLDKSYANVKQYHIVGDKVPTITGLNRWQIYDGVYPNHVDFLLSNGDGTVPLFSAENPGSKKAKLFYATKTSGHAEMVKEAPVRNKVLALLKGDETSAIEGISTSSDKKKIRYTSYAFSASKKDFQELKLEVLNREKDSEAVIRFTEEGFPDLSDVPSEVRVESGIIEDQPFVQIILPQNEAFEIIIQGKKSADIQLITYDIDEKAAFNHTFFGSISGQSEIVQRDKDIKVTSKGKRLRGKELKE